MSSHQLSIETGRHNNINRNDRKCALCQVNDIEDEFHFVLVCTVYEQLREHYIPRYYYIRPSMLKFTKLLKTSNLNLLNNLGKYCKKAFNIRKHILNQV